MFALISKILALATVNSKANTHLGWFINAAYEPVVL